jgi:hypothetical protein
MRLFWLSVCLVGLFSFPAQAQIALHGHPQKAVYGSPAEWPTFSTPQCHWRSETVQSAAITPLEHVHFDLNAPFYGELSGPLVVPFTVTLFHLSGQSVFGDRLYGARDVVWDATGSSVSPPLIGDPMGIVLFTGHLTLDPTLSSPWTTAHGWYGTEFQVETYFAGGDTMVNELIAPFYSVVDPTQPETPVTPLSHEYMAACIPIDATHPDIIWGVNFVQTPDYLPVAPITAPMTLWMDTAGYGAQGLPPATFQQRLDLNLHAGIPGTILKQVVQEGDIQTSITIDPAVLGAGTHKIAIFRNQQSTDGLAEVNTLFVMPITVGDSVPPPTTCTDPTALNNGGPLPCVYPTVPPPPIWTVGTVFSTPTPTGLHFELCAALNPNDATACHAVP